MSNHIDHSDSDSLLFIGLDDTDSDKGMCTTHIACRIMREIELSGYGKLADYPYLIRLNPTIPYKTRGNASVGLVFNLAGSNETSLSSDFSPVSLSSHFIPSVSSDTSDPFEKIMSLVTSLVENGSDINCEKTNPGVVFIHERLFSSLKGPLSSFYERAQKDVVEISDAFELIQKYSIPSFHMKLGRGLIGSLAAAGAVLNGLADTTYELLAYRTQSNIGSCRFVSSESLFKADAQTYPHTWDTVDYYGAPKKKVVCVPGSPDPVLFGIRGESPDWVLKAFHYVVSEPYEQYCIFQTNQGTDMHLIPVNSASELKDLHSYIFPGTVASIPKTIEGGHVIFQMTDCEGKKVDCAAYEPTGSFRRIIRHLIPGDFIRAVGSYKNKTINLEKIDIVSCAVMETEKNPVCPACFKRMESAGSGKGFRCKECKTKSFLKERRILLRSIEPGIYEVPPSARRHISKPLIRDASDSVKKLHPSR